MPSKRVTGGSSSSGSSYTTSSSSSTSTSSTTYTDSASYWTTDAILARHAAASATAVSAAPNASTAFEPKRQFDTYVSLGPVIGMVTDTTARILIEVSASCDVKCFLTDKYGVQHGVMKRCARENPTVFVFQELRARTTYKLTFDMPVPGLVKSSFKTLPMCWSIGKSPARIAVVSGNKFASTRDSIPHSLDLWKHLYSQCKKGEIDYIFHLGNNVYVDSDEYVHRKTEKEYSGPPGQSAYREALQYCKDLDNDQLADAEKYVCSLFRNAYRDTWCHPTTRHVLANAPNLMILNDHEICHRLGDERLDTDTLSVHSFVQYCAYRVYNQYCRSLFEDVPGSKRGSSVSDAMKIGQAYHFHAFGDLGFVFLDTRIQRTLHKDWSDEEDTAALLGSKQWADLEYALSESGYLHDCKVLLVAMSTPLAQTGGPGCCVSTKRLEERSGTWNSPDGIAEASLLLSKLFDWKAAKKGRRDAVILSGSSTDAGVTDIVDLAFEEPGSRIKQVTSGPIARSKVASGPALAHASCSPTFIGKEHQFKHTDIVKDRNYSIIDIANERSRGGGLLISAQHVVAQSQKVAVRAPHHTTKPTPACWASQPHA